MNNEGSIHAYDLHEKKVKLVAERAKQLGLSMIETGAMDSRQLMNRFENFTFDPDPFGCTMFWSWCPAE